jgi:hypothetical protein
MDISTENEDNIINSSDWSKIGLSELYKQKTILGNRMETAYNMKNNVILNSLQRGLSELEYYISIKLDDNTSNDNKNIIL